VAGEDIVVRKLNYDGKETWRWTGRLVDQRDGVMVVDALFNAPARDLGYMKLDSTDLFHEFYFAGRWFNVFQVFGADGALKGWYCNVCKPAEFQDHQIDFVDMVLDVFVYPDGKLLVLDEDEFAEKEAGTYSPEDSREAEMAVDQLVAMVERREHPFEQAGSAPPET